MNLIFITLLPCPHLFQDRETPLHIAVRTKNVEMVNLLLDHGASTDAIDKVCPLSLRPSILLPY